jgi:hypothetical protein
MEKWHEWDNPEHSLLQEFQNRTAAGQQQQGAASSQIEDKKAITTMAAFFCKIFFSCRWYGILVSQ